MLIILTGCVKRIPEPTLYRNEWQEGEVELERPSAQLQVGESLSYSVRWLGINVGKIFYKVVGIEEFAGEKAYHIKINVRTNRYLNRIFKVDDEFHSYISLKDLKPLCFKSRRREGKYRAQTLTIFDYKNGKIKFHSLLDNSRKEASLQEGVYDMVSAFIHFRTMEIKSDEINIAVIHRAKRWDVNVKIIKKGILELRGHGIQPVFLVNLKAHHGKESAKGEAWIWFSADKRRLPLLVQMKVKIPIVGSIVASLD